VAEGDDGVWRGMEKLVEKKMIKRRRENKDQMGKDYMAE
jgi:hypothetical protein